MTKSKHSKKSTSRAKLGDIVEGHFGRVVFDIKPGEDTSKDICFVCGKPATAWPHPPRAGMAHGFVEINGEIMLLCEQCFVAEEQTPELVIRKYWNAPDLKVEKGGMYESVDKLRRDIADATKERKRGAKPTN